MKILRLKLLSSDNIRESANNYQEYLLISSETETDRSLRRDLLIYAFY